jgi:tRNA(Ile)-lysidine synthetase-like protein
MCSATPFSPVRLSIFQHGLRGAAAERDAAWCRTFCAARKIPFKMIRLPVMKSRRPGESLEEAARRCRLEKWRKLAGPEDVVALGHHADDRLEELLLRLARGANASGLSGLRPERVVEGVRFVRPLLGLRRAEVEAFLRGRGVKKWREDRSNADTAFRRNAIRHKWLPLIREDAGHDRGLLASLEGLALDADFLEAEASRRLPEMTGLAAWRSLHPALLPRVLRLWLRRELGRDVVPVHAAIERLRGELARKPAGTRLLPLGGGVTLGVSRRGVELAGTV